MPQSITPYHFVLTLQLPNGSPTSRSGVVNPQPGTTRDQVFVQLVESLFGLRLDDVVVLHFSLTPNQL